VTPPNLTASPIFQITPKQNEALGLMRDPTKRYIKLVGGARSTKTTIIVRQMIGRAIHFPSARQASLRLHMVDAVNSLWLDTIPKVLANFYPGLSAADGNIRQVNARGEMRLEFWNKAEYWIGGLDDKERVDKILGREFVGLHHNEVSQISYQSILKTRTRLSQEVFNPDMATSENPKGRLLQKEYDDLNPVGKSHWSYVEYDLGLDPMERERRLDRSLYASLRMNPKDNPHLSEEYMRSLAAMPLAMRLRFLEGMDQDELAGALWTLSAISAARGNQATPQSLPVPMRRIIIAVDPSGTSGEGIGQGDDVGIIVVGKGIDDRGYVLEDGTMNGPPAAWARKVEDLRIKWGADLVVAEKNYGGAMVLEVLRHANPNTPVEMVNASHGKAVRAEPVSLLYTQNDGTKIVHCGNFYALEEEMCSVKQGDTTPEIKQRLGRSPNRLDVLVYAVSKLFDLSSAEALMKFYEGQADSDAAARKNQTAVSGVFKPFSDEPEIKQPGFEDISTNSTFML
jgi:hypothetical protein